jgi:hypothetical protein
VAEPLAQTFPAYLEASLAILRAEAPVHFQATRLRLDGRAVVVRIGGAPPTRICLSGLPPFVHPRADGDVEVIVSECDLAAFLEGRLTVEDAVENDRLALRGALDHLLPLLDALQAWLHGSLRTPSSMQLHQRYLAQHPQQDQHHG